MLGRYGRGMKRPAFVVLALVLFGIAGLAALYPGFQAGAQGDAVSGPMPRTAIVFTGQFDRIHFGIRLLEDQVIDRLLISGVNPRSGLDPDRFEVQFGLSPGLLAAMESGRIILATGANTTLENAVEASCWLALHPDIHDAVLITSRRHMPRASLALERALPAGFTIIRAVSDVKGGHEQLPALLEEFPKFVVTWIVTMFPMSIWPAEPISICMEI